MKRKDFSSNSGPGNFTIREIAKAFFWDRKFYAIVGASIVLAIVGPFGTYDELGLQSRFVYWTVAVAGVGFFMTLAVPVALRLRALSGLPQIVRVTIGAAVAAFPGTSIILFVEAVFRPQHANEAFFSIWPQVAILGAIISAMEFIDWIPKKIRPVPKALPKSRLHERLPPEAGGDIISLSMQDHYVEVATTRGRFLLLMRMADAVAELDGVSGAQVHRSHWAAARHATGLRPHGKKHLLKLSDGRELPVSATYVGSAESLLSLRASQSA